MYCSNCGKQIKDGAKFCPYCGDSQNAVPNQPKVNQKENIRARQESYAYGNEAPVTGVQETSTKFSLFFFRFWLKGTITVNQRQVRISTANTLGKYLPAGKNNQTIPMGQISSAETRTSYKGKTIFIGILLLIIGFAIMNGNLGDDGSGSGVFFGLLLGLFGFLKILSGIKTEFIIQRAGTDFKLSIPSYDKKKILNIKDVIDQALVYETEKMDTIRSTDRIIREMRMQNQNMW